MFKRRYNDDLDEESDDDNEAKHFRKLNDDDGTNESNEWETVESESDDASSAASVVAISDNDENENNDEESFSRLKMLQSLIRSAKSSGYCSTGGEANELPSHPGLYVDDFGDVALPVTKDVAENLIKICKLAPYGHKYETKFDTKVRDTYQLEPSCIKIKNPEWNIALKKLVERVAKQLGCHDTVESKLYKLLLYKTGGHFKKHTDTEKVKNMFGTLIIQLPSIHEGGELICYDTGTTQSVYDFGNKTGKAPFMSHFAAHYADIEHEINEIKSGYRLALVYSLSWVNGNGNDEKTNRDIIGQTVTCLNELGNYNSRFGILLDHRYTTSSLSQNGAKALKGIDNDRFNLLWNANAKLPTEKQFNFYIAHASQVVESYDITGDMGDDEEYVEKNTTKNDSDWEENQRSKFIKAWYDVDGVPCLKNANLKLDFFTKIIDPNSKKNIYADLEDDMNWGKQRHVKIDGYTGNEGMNKTTTYHRYLLAIWPIAHDFGTMIKMSINDAIDCLYKTVDSDYTKAEYQEKLRLVFDELKNKKINTHSNKLVEILIKVKKLEFCKIYLSCLQTVQPKELARFINAFSLNDFKDNLEKWLKLTYENIAVNCEVVNELNTICGENTAYECLKKFILPILDDKENFESKTVSQVVNVGYSYMYGTFQRDPTKNISMYFQLAATILLFKHKGVDLWMDKYTNILLKILDQKMLKSLLNMFMDKEIFCTSQALLKLFEVRFSWLKEKLKDVPKFSWSMPGSIPGHPQVEAFLRSERQQMTYTGAFHGINDARYFARSHESSINGYSLRMTTSGVGRKATVDITKTKGYYENQVRNFHDIQVEAKRIEKILNNKKP